MLLHLWEINENQVQTNTKKTLLNDYLVGWVSSPDILTYRISPQPEKNAISCSAESCIEIDYSFKFNTTIIRTFPAWENLEYYYFLKKKTS